jgi:TRAP-type mannitol/chloroaromatic compound transport system permease large subunit
VLWALLPFLIAAGYGRLNWQMVKESVRLTGRTTAMVCWLFVGASLFAAVFARLGVQAQLEQWVLSACHAALNMALAGACPVATTVSLRRITTREVRGRGW